ncbi:MAG: hypothetical protein M0R00_09675 [Candidatus Omnitrophica bacterium]|jgi:hypothetical protein|nr:hypothetical protein [Candidatus Omnitrophota bacterium]
MVKIKEIKEAKAFNDYRDYLIGKYYKTYFNTEDKILNVILNDSITYLVQDVISGEKRTHGTKIFWQEVYQK